MKLFDVYPRYAIAPVRANDVFVYDAEDKAYLDLYGGHAVISIGHQHTQFTAALKTQMEQLMYYSNAVENPLQEELAQRLGSACGMNDYQLFLCSTGAEANENALKLASFHTQKSRVVAFYNSFHGRTSAAVAATDSPKLRAPINTHHQVDFLPFNAPQKLEALLQQGDVAAVIIECIQGVGGLAQPDAAFVQQLQQLCLKYDCLLIADEVQSGFGRTGHFFAFQAYGIQPDIISMAKGMGNGFPVGGVLIHPKIKPSYGLLGTTFGGNHLACSAVLAVVEVIIAEALMENATAMGEYFFTKMKKFPHLIPKGKGLMLGIDCGTPVAEIRKELLYKHNIFTGGSSNANLLRLLPPLSLKTSHWDQFFSALKNVL